jgi:DNA-binding LacI/PurR family transcriptional regulator
VAGCLLWSHGLREHAEAIVGALAQYGKPIAVTDEHTGVRVSPQAARGVRVAVFPVASDEHAGEDIGRFLTGNGHRRVAFFTRNRFDTWAMGRFRGVRSWFESAGLRDAVMLFDAAVPSEWGEFRARVGASCEYQELMRGVANVGCVYGGRGTAEVQEAGLQILNYIWDDYAAAYLVPCFRSAARDRDLTAWVCSNDEVGRAAMTFLRRERLTPGVDRTVVGFDDEIVSSGMGLTSYNFGVAAQAVACVRAVLLPTGVRPGTGVVVREIPGFIVARSSSGRAR